MQPEKMQLYEKFQNIQLCILLCVTCGCRLWIILSFQYEAIILGENQTFSSYCLQYVLINEINQRPCIIMSGTMVLNVLLHFFHNQGCMQNYFNVCDWFPGTKASHSFIGFHFSWRNALIYFCSSHDFTCTLMFNVAFQMKKLIPSCVTAYQ